MKLKNPKKILIIQTAFIGDVILATVLFEELKAQFTDVLFDFVLRHGNEGVLKDHPWVDKLFVWEKRDKKLRNLVNLIREIRLLKYDAVINLQRFGSSGLMTLLSKSGHKVGYKKNPFSMFFHERVEHSFGKGVHETDRILKLIKSNSKGVRPNLHISEAVSSSVEKYKSSKYITIAPTSVWFTKQFPIDRWVSFINQSDYNGTIILLGGNNDSATCESILKSSQSKRITNLSGELSLLQSAALMKDAEMNFVNDSAPLHLCSAVDANVTAVFCSTVPDFGFGPLSSNSKVVEIKESLPCRPCGLHGRKKCPENHFNCANKIEINELVKRTKQTT